MIYSKEKKGFEYWAQLNEIEKIKLYIKYLGYSCLSDNKSKNQIFYKNGNKINFKMK